MTEPRSGRLTEFGAVVMELMSRRGITQWAALSALLKENNHDFKPARISNWIYGRHPVNRAFGRALNEVLRLNDGERRKLADAFLFGQDTPAGKEESAV